VVAPAFARAGLDTLDELGYAILPDALDGAPAVRELARSLTVRAVAAPPDA